MMSEFMRFRVIQASSRDQLETELNKPANLGYKLVGVTGAFSDPQTVPMGQQPGVVIAVLELENKPANTKINLGE